LEGMKRCENLENPLCLSSITDQDEAYRLTVGVDMIQQLRVCIFLRVRWLEHAH